MAANLVKAGLEVIGYNRSPARVEQLVAAGGQRRQGHRRDGSGTPTWWPPCCPTPDVAGRAVADDAASSRPRQGRALVVDFSSIRPDVAAALAADGAERGFRVPGRAGVRRRGQRHRGGALDHGRRRRRGLRGAAAPVSSTRWARPSCTSGPRARVRTVKAANQLIVAGHLELLAEAIVFLEAYGVDTEAGAAGAGRRAGLRAPCSSARGPTMLARDFKPGFRIALHDKDMGIVTAAAREAGVVIPLGAAVAQLVASLKAQGDGGLDHSALLKLVSQLSGRHERQGVEKMPRMTAADAAVAILRREGVTNAFGLPGAAINPFYAAMRRDGGITTSLARHVEGASHMAEGYTGPAAGNIGVCVGTSGPAGTDMITGLYSASADSIPILCITGQAPVRQAAQGGLPGGRHRGHRPPADQDGDDRARAGPGARRVPAGVPPDALGPARPGADRPAVRRAAWPRSTSTSTPYEPLPVYKPAATRAQIAKALDMLDAAERPIIVAGGGIINADAGGPAGGVRRAHRHAGGADADGLGRACPTTTG